MKKTKINGKEIIKKRTKKIKQNFKILKEKCFTIYSEVKSIIIRDIKNNTNWTYDYQVGATVYNNKVNSKIKDSNGIEYKIVNVIDTEPTLVYEVEPVEMRVD